MLTILQAICLILSPCAIAHLPARCLSLRPACWSACFGMAYVTMNFDEGRYQCLVIKSSLMQLQACGTIVGRLCFRCVCKLLARIGNVVFHMCWLSLTGCCKCLQSLSLLSAAPKHSVSFCFITLYSPIEIFLLGHFVVLQLIAAVSKLVALRCMSAMSEWMTPLPGDDCSICKGNCSL